jgi:hypothetical protein
MTSDPFDRRRQMKILFGVLAVALIVSAVVGFLVFYMGQAHSRF